MVDTGILATSTKLHLGALLLSVLSGCEAIFQQPKSAVHLAVFGGGGLIVAAASTVAKLFHDKGIHIATIEQAGAELVKELPLLKADLSVFVTWLSTQFPELSTHITSLEDRLATEEQKVITAIPDHAAIATVVREILGSIVPPAADPTTPVA